VATRGVQPLSQGLASVFDFHLGRAFPGVRVHEAHFEPPLADAVRQVAFGIPFLCEEDNFFNFRDRETPYRRSLEICPALRSRWWLVSGDEGAFREEAEPFRSECAAQVFEDVKPGPGMLLRTWYTFPHHFDTFSRALLTLFEVSTLEGWVDVMHRAHDVVEPGIGPCRDYSWWFSTCFFVLYIFFCSFFSLNLVVSVVMDKFQQEMDASLAQESNPDIPNATQVVLKKMGKAPHKSPELDGQRGVVIGYDGNGNNGKGEYLVALKAGRQSLPRTNLRPVTETGELLVVAEEDLMEPGQQRKQTNLLLHLDGIFNKQRMKPPSIPNHCFAKFCRFVFLSDKFEYLIMNLIIINILMLCYNLDGSPPSTQPAYLKLYNDVTLPIYVIEAIFKIIAVGGEYFKDPWNIFDFSVVALSLFGELIDRLNLFSSDDFSDVFMIVRSLRVLRLLRYNRGVKVIMQSALWCIPSVVNIILLLTLFYFIYAIAAMNIFRHIPDGRLLGEDLNFRPVMMQGSTVSFTGFSTAFFTFFYMSTGEAWNIIMHDCWQPPACNPAIAPLVLEDWSPADCPPELSHVTDSPNWWAVPFFIVFMVQCNFMLLNVIIAILLENYELCSSSASEGSSGGGLNFEDYQTFETTWFCFDITKSRYLHLTMLIPFLHALPPRPYRMLREVDSHGDVEHLQYSAEQIVLKIHAVLSPGHTVHISHVWTALLLLHWESEHKLRFEITRGRILTAMSKYQEWLWQGGRQNDLSLRNAVEDGEKETRYVPTAASYLRKNGASVFPASLDLGAGGPRAVAARWRAFAEKEAKRTLQQSLSQPFKLALAFGSREEAEEVWERVSEESRPSLRLPNSSPRIEADDVTGEVVLEVIQATLDATAAKRSYFYVDEFFAAIIVQRRIRSRHRQRRDGRGPSRISRIRQDGWCSYFHGRNDHVKFMQRDAKTTWLQWLLQPAQAVLLKSIYTFEQVVRTKMRMKYTNLWRDAAGYSNLFEFTDRVNSLVSRIVEECEHCSDLKWATMSKKWRRGIIEANVTAFLIRREKLPNGLYLDFTVRKEGRCVDVPGLQHLWDGGQGLDRTPRRPGEVESDRPPRRRTEEQEKARASLQRRASERRRSSNLSQKRTSPYSPPVSPKSSSRSSDR
jgi:hypothetical protein